MLGRTKDQIRTTEQVNAAMAACKALKLDALIIIGGIYQAVLLVHYGSSVHTQRDIHPNICIIF